MTVEQQIATLRTVLATYPHTNALKQGAIASPDIALAFADVKPTHKAFKPMVRELAFDVCEMAIVTFLQAKTHGKPLSLLPAVMLGRFQHHCLLHNADRERLRPEQLAGRRVGVRAYSQTTGVWLRGILQHDYGVDLSSVRWVTFEDAHVAEYRDPPGVERAPADKDLTAMLLSGELDAAIYGAELPDDPRIQSVIPDPQAAAQAWYRQHRCVPVNHMVVVTKALATCRPDVVREVYGLLARGKEAVSSAAGVDLTPFGVEPNRPSLALIIDYAFEQGLIPRRLTVDDLFEDFERVMGGSSQPA
jgi:4,5-dihydroxyphthalate decarboxylase